MVQQSQLRLFSAKLQAGHIHALVVGSSAMVDIFFFRQLYRLESFNTFFDDNLEPLTARATSNKCKVGMAHKCVSAHLRFPWQEKLLAPLIATPNEDTQLEEKVIKREKRKGLRYRQHKSFVCNKMDEVL